jgi:two-component system, LytTR family, response regulator
LIRCLIIDDEIHNQLLLKKLVETGCPQLTLCGIANNVREGKLLIQKEHPQLVFLDIEMPDGTGFDLLEQLKPVDFEVVFVTGFGDYAVKAFKYSALDYIMKPVMLDDLVIAVQKAMEKIGSKTIGQRLEAFLQVQQGKQPQRIALPSKEGLEFYDIADIVSCSADGSYTRFILSDGRKIMTTGLLKDFEELLPPEFFCRIHHSHIINLNFIKKYYRGRGGYVELATGDTIEVSNNKKDEFLARFGKT